MPKYVTREGDTLDKIISGYYGNQRGQGVEAILEANPGLSARGPVLAAGIEIKLPTIPDPIEREGVRLWS